MSSQVIITSIGIAYDTKLQVSSYHHEGRIGPPLIIQEKDIPDALKQQILELAQKHAAKYWNAKA